METEIGISFHRRGRLGCGMGTVNSQFITLPDEIAAKDNIIIGVVRFGSSSWVLCSGG